MTGKKRFSIIILFPLMALAHPGIGVVKDSKGNIYYTDLHRVERITNGIRTVIVPHVHTHELYVDPNDNLYGEGGDYDEKANKFYHYLWIYRTNGQTDTVIGMKEAYVHQDFSLARDTYGNEYYIKRFLHQPDTKHIYRKSPGGKETIFATGDFKGVTWLHPQEDGSLFYVFDNAIIKIDASGNRQLIKDSIGNTKPSFKFSGNSITIWGVWKDGADNIYAAVFSDQTVKKIDAGGNMVPVYQSKGARAPLHGVFDHNNRLWILESSDKNEVRVTLVETNPATRGKTNPNLRIYMIISLVALGILLLYLKCRNVNPARVRKKSAIWEWR